MQKLINVPRTVLSIVGGAVLLLVLSSLVFSIRVHAEGQPVLTVGVKDVNNVFVTSAPINSQVHGTVQVASSTASTTPAGTVDFNLYNNTSCSGTASVQAGVTLVNGIANAATTTVTASGLSYKVHYNGDQNNAAGDSGCAVGTPTSASTSLTTTLSTTTAQAGNTVHDSATLVGATTNASGTVSYIVYTNNVCSAGAQSAGVKTVSNRVIPDSDTIQFNTPGTYYWQVIYSGDSQNSAATSSCQSEALQIIATSTAPTTGRIIVDKITNPAGNSTSFHFITTGSGYSAFDLTDTAVPNSQTLATGTYSVAEQSMSDWSLTSATCSRNNGASNTYSPGTSLTLNAGDTIACIFTNTLQATTTPPDKGNHGDKDKNDNDDDNSGNGNDDDNGNNNQHGNGIGQFVRDLNQRIHNRLDSALRAHGLR